MAIVAPSYNLLLPFKRPLEPIRQGRSISSLTFSAFYTFRVFAGEGSPAKFILDSRSARSLAFRARTLADRER